MWHPAAIALILAVASGGEQANQPIVSVQPPADPVSITSPRAGESLTGAKQIRIAWESQLGPDTLYSILYSPDGASFGRSIASGITSLEYIWEPGQTQDIRGWIKVKAFRAGYVMGQSVVQVSFIPETAIVVSKANQRVFYFSGGRLANSFVCSTALPGYDLAPGHYRVYSRERSHWSKKWEVAMPNSLFFHRGYALHATTMVRQLGRPASHGCVRLHPRDARTLYNKVSVGTPVIVLARSKDCSFLLESPKRVALSTGQIPL